VEPHVKHRITGAIVLVSLIVIFVPALLSGPQRAPTSVPAQPGHGASQTFRSDDRVGSAGSVIVPESATPAAAAVPAMPRANSDDSVAHVSVDPAVRDAKSPLKSPSASEPSRSAPSPKGASAGSLPLKGAPAAPGPAASAGAWAVQVGGFSSRPNAQRLVARLRQEAFEAYVSETGSGGRAVFRVRAGPVRDRGAAEALLRRLKSRGHSGSVVTNP